MKFSINFDRKISIAPMMNLTERHFRYFFRLISKYPVLYTEMIPETTIYYNLKNKEKIRKILEFHPVEHPIICQIGSSDSKKIQEIIPIIEEFGYDGINLNCGCPSEKVRSGNFGIALMLNQKNLIKIIEVAKSKTHLPISIKHRIGLESKEIKTNYEYLRSFIKNCYIAGCEHFIIHARFAILEKDPKKNRTIPPLLYEWVYKIKEEFPFLKIEINGGIQNLQDIKKHLSYNIDKVMIGRAAYYNPYEFVELDKAFMDSNQKIPTRTEIFRKLFPYILEQLEKGIYPHRILPHTYGLFYPLPYSQKWKKFLTEEFLKLKKLKIQEIKKEQILEILEKSLYFFKDLYSTINV